MTHHSADVDMTGLYPWQAWRWFWCGAALFILAACAEEGSPACRRAAAERGFASCHHMSRADRAHEFAVAHRLETATCYDTSTWCSGTLAGRPVRYKCTEVGCNFLD